MNFYFTEFDNPFGKGIISSFDDKICWLSFRDQGQKFKNFIESYIDEVYSAALKTNFTRFKERYAPVARMITAKKFGVIEDSSKFKDVLQLIDEYFTGNQVDFRQVETVYLEGTEFQRRVWDELKMIEYGTVKSYKDIAELTGNKGASRAVGSANGKNFIPLIIPCHRVIKADGTIGGYSAGLDIKKVLLDIENIKIKPDSNSQD